MRQIQGAGGGGCFAGHTLVKTGDVEKRIDEIKEGDYVWSFDDQGRIHESKVLKVHKHEDEKIVEYKLWGGIKLCATPNHWVLNQYNAFVEIGSLGFDDCLVNTDDHLLPIVGKKELENGTVYNLTVEDHHTFFAGGIRVHNAGLGIAGSGGGGGGKGGGGGSQHVPTEADDSLQSRQMATVLDLLAEGEIQGLDDGNKSVYLGGTPVQSPGGTNNFEGFTIITRNGTQGQSYISSLAGAESEKQVNVTVIQSTPVIRQITDTDVDRVRVTIKIPALQVVEDDGDIVGHSVQYELQAQYNGGGYSTFAVDTVTGKSSASYQRDYMVNLAGAFPVDIKVIRLSPDDASARKQSKTIWSSYTEIIDEKLRYPNSALIYLRFDARNFGSIPARKYLVRGLKIQHPHNASIDTSTYLGRVTYSGTFNGTLGAAQWSSDPAWCLWDLLTNTRYGASIPAASLDRYDFYTISQYCNELVSDGKGGQEPRFALNLLINSRDEVYNVIQELTSLFRGISYYASGSLVLQQDKPSDSQYLIGPSNVVGGEFIYSGTSQKARHTTCTVAYQRYDSLGEVQYEYVEDADAVAKFGVINADFRAVGCYSQGQAHRAGKWLLLSENNLTQTVSFGISIESGITLRPGMVIDISDPVRAGTRRSGRCSTGSTTTQVVIDSATDLSVDMGNSPTISVILPTGLIETKTITGISGTTVSISDSFSVAPAQAAVWLIQTTDVQSQQYRVLNVVESGDGGYAVTALEYNSSIYEAIESDINLTQRDITDLSAEPDPVSSISSTEFLYQEGQTVHSAVDVSWISPTTNVSEFRVQYKIDNDNWQVLTTTSPSVTIRQTRPGLLQLQVQAYNHLGKGSQISTSSIELIGKTARPGDPTNLTFEAISANSGRLRWDKSTDLDVLVGGSVSIKHSSKTDGSGTWANSVSLIPAKSGIQTEAIVPLVEGEVLVKFVDDGGRQSTNAASVIVDLPDTMNQLGVFTQREDEDSPPFQGTATNCHYSETEDALVLDGQNLDEMPDFDAIVNFDVLGDIDATGTYTFNEKIDLGATYSVDLKRHFATVGYLPADLLDSRASTVDTFADWDGEVQNVDAKLYMRSTSGDPASGGSSWSSWQEFVNGTFRNRGFEFKTTLTSSDTDESIKVTELGVSATLQRRSEQSDGAIASGTASGGKTVSFSKSFFTGTAALGGANSKLPSIGIVAQNMQANDIVNVTAVTATNFTVKFQNGGAVVDRNFTWSAVGYGLGS